MKNLNSIASDLFNKIRGRFQDVTIGDEEGKVTNVPEDARYFDFSFQNNGTDLGKVSVSLDEDEGVTVVVGRDIVQNQEEDVQDLWFNFLKELRVFAKKRLLNFDVRDINKSNLNKRDYEFLAANRPGDNTMAESKMYGTNKTSFQKIGNARLAIKHIAPINTESATGRTQKIGAIFIESPTGERFKYPFKHLSGARAMAMHVSEGGNAYDDFGKYISGLSEEVAKLRKFNQYINRSSVMAEGLKDYAPIVKERVSVIKKEISNLQKHAYYSEAVANYTAPVVEDVPNDVAENWIDQLTIKQFNEELKDVFPYIYNLVSEATRAKELGPNDLDESGLQYYTGVKKHGKEYMKKAAQAGREGASQEELGRLKDKYSKAEKKKTKEEFELEQAFEDAMGQFADHVCEECGNPSWRTLDEEKQKGLDGKVCWKGYRRMGTKMKGGKRVDNCVKVKEDEIEEGLGSMLKNIAGSVKNAFKPGVAITPGSVKQAEYILQKVLQGGFDSLNSKERQFMTNFSDATLKGLQAQAAEGEDKVSQDKPTDMDVQIGPDGALSKAGEPAQEKPQTPIGEYILSYFDRETGKFPKGETAVLTAVQKEYGDNYVKPAAQFMQKIETMVAQRQAEEMTQSRYPETQMIKQLAGLN